MTARFEGGSSYFGLQHVVPGAFNVGLIGSICTALPSVPGPGGAHPDGVPGVLGGGISASCCGVWPRRLPSGMSRPASTQGLTLIHKFRV